MAADLHNGITQQTPNASRSAHPTRSPQRMWLFDGDRPDTGVSSLDDREAYKEQLSGLRAAAVSSVYDVNGIDGVIDLAKSVQYPGSVGQTAATVIQEESAALELLDSDEQRSMNFAAGYVQSKLTDEGWDWLHRVVGEFGDRPQIQARLLLASPELERAWEVLDSLTEEVAESYWSEFSLLRMAPNLAPSVAEASGVCAAQHNRTAGTLEGDRPKHRRTGSTDSTFGFSDRMGIRP